MKRLNLLLATAMLAVSMTGCASIVSKSNWPVTVQSNPTGAKCEIVKDNGIKLHTGETPMTVNLESSSGFFSSAKYKINCNKDGNQASSELSARLNGWYIGNLAFGGLIGFLIVDPATGAMWRLDDTTVVNMAGNTTTPVATPATPAVIAPQNQNVNPATGALIQADTKI